MENKKFNIGGREYSSEISEAEKEEINVLHRNTPEVQAAAISALDMIKNFIRRRFCCINKKISRRNNRIKKMNHHTQHTVFRELHIEKVPSPDKLFELMQMHQQKIENEVIHQRKLFLNNLKDVEVTATPGYSVDLYDPFVFISIRFNLNGKEEKIKTRVPKRTFEDESFLYRRIFRAIYGKVARNFLSAVTINKDFSL